MSGHIALHRSAFDHPLLRDAERFKAWFWLVSEAAWKPKRHDVHGKIVKVQRGQISVSVRQLADAWGWSKSSVERFLTRLKAETMIETDTGTGRLLITICNYEKYQEVSGKTGTATGTRSGTRAGQQRDIKEEGNKGIREEEAKASPSTGGKKPADPAKLKPVKPKPEAGLPWHGIPEWIPLDLWHSFLRWRRDAKRYVNADAAALLIQELTELKDAGYPPGEVLNQSVKNGWLALFPLDPPKDQANGRPHQPPRESTRETGQRIADELSRAVAAR